VKKFYVLMLSAAVVLGGTWWALSYAFAQTADDDSKPITITKTKKEWNEWLQKQIADAQAKQQVTAEKIGQASNWHVVEFKGIEYTVYTGPGQAMMARFAPSAKSGGTRGTTGTAPRSSAGTATRPGAATGATAEPATRVPATRTPAP
jgi:hypothetical protein